MIEITVSDEKYKVRGFYHDGRFDFAPKDSFMTHPVLSVERWLPEENKYDLPELIDLWGTSNIHGWMQNHYVDYNGLTFNVSKDEERKMLADALEEAFAIEEL